jgi:hypothetical protein
MIALLSHSFDTAAQQAVAAWSLKEAPLLGEKGVVGWLGGQPPAAHHCRRVYGRVGN